jgi:hypothetical protein
VVSVTSWIFIEASVHPQIAELRRLRSALQFTQGEGLTVNMFFRKLYQSDSMGLYAHCIGSITDDAKRGLLIYTRH